MKTGGNGGASRRPPEGFRVFRGTQAGGTPGKLVVGAHSVGTRWNKGSYVGELFNSPNAPQKMALRAARKMMLDGWASRDDNAMASAYLTMRKTLDELKIAGAGVVKQPPRYCTVDGCVRLHSAKGLCDACYHKARKLAKAGGE